MPWELATPYSHDHGDGSPVEQLTHIKLWHFAMSMEMVERTELALHLMYGTMQEISGVNVFVPGKKHFIPVTIKDIAEELDGAGGILSEADPILSIFIATSLIVSGDVGKRVYDILKGHIWQRLRDDGKIGAGEVV